MTKTFSDHGSHEDPGQMRTLQATSARFVEHEGQFLAFALSFVLIGMFGFLHHRIFRADTPNDGRRGVVNLAWMGTSCSCRWSRR